MNHQRLFGIASLATASALFAALAYEPADLAATLGVQNVADEGSVVVGGLALVAAGALAGIVTLRRASAQRATARIS